MANEEKSSILHENLDGILFIVNKVTLLWFECKCF